MSRVTVREVVILLTTAAIGYFWWQDRRNLALELQFMDREVRKVENIVVRARESHEYRQRTN
jgi:hypothetical protein